MRDNELLSQDEINEIMGTAGYLWEPTGDTYYSDSIGGESTFGIAYDRMVVEKGRTHWHGSLYTVSEPRDEEGSFSYDLFPDDDDDMYVMVNEQEFSTADEARAWCESSDASRFGDDA
jgi:hypothetical protein